MKKMKVLLGCQPTGKLHIGNYLGCLKKGIKYQEEGHDVIFMLANYHSLTTNNSTDITSWSFFDAASCESSIINSAG